MMMLKKIAIRHIAETNEPTHTQMLKCIHIGITVVAEKIAQNNQVEQENNTQTFVLEKLGHIISSDKTKYGAQKILFIVCILKR